MKYQVIISETALKQLLKCDPQIAVLIYSFLKKKLENCENPRYIGTALKGNLKGLWRYRVGSYRLLCLIEDDKIIITVLEVGHRKEVYK